MNLAAVEHYFSDFLSVMETRRRSGDAVITDRLPIDLPSVSGDAEDPHEHLRSLYLPHNVRVIGTANMDETTRSFSPKVLDRAFSIEFNDVDLTAFPAAPEEPVHSASAGELARRLVDQNNPVTVHEMYLDLRELCDEVAGLMESIRTILEPAGPVIRLPPQRRVVPVPVALERGRSGCRASPRGGVGFVHSPESAAQDTRPERKAARVFGKPRGLASGGIGRGSGCRPKSALSEERGQGEAHAGTS